jgi:uncharacterized membrane protein
MSFKGFSKFQSIRPEHFFLVMACTFGSLFVILVPPFNNPDEPVHFFRVYQLSTFNLFGQKSNGTVLTRIPSSFIPSVENNLLSASGKQINTHPDVKSSPSAIIKTLTYGLREDHTELTKYSAGVAYAPTSYIPQVVVTEIGRLFKLPAVMILYCMRFAGLAVYIVAIYYAIKLLPYRKWTITLLTLLPMSLAQAAAVTADSSLLAALVLFLAIILKSRSEHHGELSTRLRITLAFVTIVLGMSKQIFIIAVPLLLLIPSRVFISKKAHNIYLGSLLVGTGFLALIWDLVNPIFRTSLSNSGAGADAKAQIVQTLHHPLHLIIVAFNTFINQNSNTLYSMFAGNFGWLDTQIPIWAVCLVIGCVVYCLLTEYDTQSKIPTKYYNLSITTVAIILFAATCAIFYVYWTPVGGRQIAGLQGRYFIPSIILLGLLQRRKLFKVNEKQYRMIVLFTIPTVLVVSVLTIIGRFYWGV